MLSKIQYLKIIKRLFVYFPDLINLQSHGTTGVTANIIKQFFIYMSHPINISTVCIIYHAWRHAHLNIAILGREYTTKYLLKPSLIWNKLCCALQAVIYHYFFYPKTNHAIHEHNMPFNSIYQKSIYIMYILNILYEVQYFHHKLIIISIVFGCLTHHDNHLCNITLVRQHYLWWDLSEWEEEDSRHLHTEL